MNEDKQIIWEAVLEAMRKYCYALPLECTEAMDSTIGAYHELFDGNPETPEKNHPTPLLKAIAKKLLPETFAVRIVEAIRVLNGI